MAARPKNQVGTLPCLCCGERVPVKETESGTLNFSCPWCEFPGYAKVGTIANRRVRAAMTPLDTSPAPPAPADPPASDPAPAATPAPAPAPRKATPIFPFM